MGEPVSCLVPLDRAGAVLGDPGQPNDRATVSIHVVRGAANRSLHMKAADAINMALRIFDVTGCRRSSCPACLVAGAISGAAVAATFAMIIGGFLP